MAWACKVGARTVRFDDLSPAAWIRVHEEHGSWAEAYSAPLANPAACLTIIEECVKVAEPDADAKARVGELCPSIRSVADMLVEADDDLPSVVTDGVPQKGDDGSTAG